MGRMICSIGMTAAAALLTGCAVSPDYRAPDTAVPSAFSQASPPVVMPARPGQGDPALDRLIERALASNLDVKRAAARIAMSRAQTRIARASIGPTLTAGAQGSVVGLSENSSLASIASRALAPGNGGGPGAAGPPGDTIETYQLGFDAAWELDLFGGAARTVEAARAQEQAAIWNARDAAVMLTAEVTRGYWRYRALQQRLALADQAEAVRAEALNYDRVRQRNGVVTSLDARQGERDLAASRAQRQDLRAQRDAQAHALAVLLGEPPLALDAELAAPAAPAPPAADIAPGLPADLMRRRPDIRAAERRLAAVTAQTSAAVAGLYPRISLTGGANLVSSSLRTLLEAASFQPSAALAVSLPLLDGGRRHGTVDLRRAEADEAALAYRATVLTALREVEDALTRLQADHERLAQFTASHAAARDAHDTLTVRARHGIVPQMDLLEARAVLLAASDAMILGEAAIRDDQAALYKALGGAPDAKET